MKAKITAVITYTAADEEAGELVREEIVRFLEALRELGYQVEFVEEVV